MYSKIGKTYRLIGRQCKATMTTATNESNGFMFLTERESE